MWARCGGIWGLINYMPSGRKERREAAAEEVAAEERKESLKRVWSNCRLLCSLACFVTDKVDFILCVRCFIVLALVVMILDGLISPKKLRQWTDRETLHLLEAILQYGEDWKNVAEHVGSRTEKECVARFIKLPFGEQFLGPLETCDDSTYHQKKDQVTAETGGGDVVDQLSPLADAIDPIMAQVALSAMVGSEVAETAAQASVAALHEVDLAD